MSIAPESSLAAARLRKLRSRHWWGGVDGLSLDFKDFSFATYNVKAKLITEAGIQALKDKGKKVNLFTVNDPHEFNRFVNAGVDGIITDFPQRFAKKNRLIR